MTAKVGFIFRNMWKSTTQVVRVMSQEEFEKNMMARGAINFPADVYERSMMAAIYGYSDEALQEAQKAYIRGDAELGSGVVSTGRRKSKNSEQKQLNITDSVETRRKYNPLYWSYALCFRARTTLHRWIDTFGMPPVHAKANHTQKIYTDRTAGRTSAKAVVTALFLPFEVTSLLLAKMADFGSFVYRSMKGSRGKKNEKFSQTGSRVANKIEETFSSEKNLSSRTPSPRSTTRMVSSPASSRPQTPVLSTSKIAVKEGAPKAARVVRPKVKTFFIEEIDNSDGGVVRFHHENQPSEQGIFSKHGVKTEEIYGADGSKLTIHYDPVLEEKFGIFGHPAAPMSAEKLENVVQADRNARKSMDPSKKRE